MEALTTIFRGMLNGATAINDNFAKIKATIDGMPTTSAWTTLSLNSGVTNVSSVYPLQYRVSGGFIEFRGAIQCSATDQLTVCTVPSGFGNVRGGANMGLATGSGYNVYVVTLTSSRVLQINRAAGSSQIEWVSINGLRFPLIA